MEDSNIVFSCKGIERSCVEYLYLHFILVVAMLLYCMLLSYGTI